MVLAFQLLYIISIQHYMQVVALPSHIQNGRKISVGAVLAHWLVTIVYGYWSLPILIHGEITISVPRHIRAILA
jgi:uncharacterized membrane protein (DUF485 family)